MNYAETRLVQMSRTGDRSAFVELVSLYKHKIHRLAYRMLNNSHDSEDIVQETFMRVYMNLNRFDDKQSFSTWIYRIGKNVCVDLLRKKKTVYSLDATINDDEDTNHYGIVASEEATPENSFLQSEAEQQIGQTINKLSDKYKAIVTLYYVHDYSMQEISDKLDLPVTTVKTRLHRGRELLRKKWGITILLNVIIIFYSMIIFM